MDPALTRLLLVAALIAATTLVGRWWQSRDGRITTTAGRPSAPTTASGGSDTAATDEPRFTDAERLELGIAGRRQSAVLFGSPTCTPCESVKTLLREVETEDDEFGWVYVDAADRLDLANEHKVRRVPTLLVLDETGAVTARASGVPGRDELFAALDATAAEAA